MKALDKYGVISLLCQSTHQWGMYISFHSEDKESELFKAAPYLTNIENIENILHQKESILLFETEIEMQTHYDLTVGDDGPTNLNDYNGEAKVYALTCDCDGQLLSENT